MNIMPLIFIIFVLAILPQDFLIYAIMIKINNVEIERTPIGWLVDYPGDGIGIRFPLNMPLRKVMFSVLCSLARIEFSYKSRFGKFY